MPRRRVSRWVLGIVGGLLLLVATSAIVVETTWFKERLRRVVVNRAGDVLNGQLTAESLTGSLLTGIELHHVRFAQASGPVFSVDTLALRYDPRILMRGKLFFRELALTQPVVHIAQHADGWNVANLVKPTSSSGKSSEVQFERLSISEGELFVEPEGASARHVSHLNAGLRVSYSADRVAINADSLAGQDVETGLIVRTGTGTLEQTAQKLTATLNLDSSAGQLAANLTGTTYKGSRVLDTNLSLGRLNVAPILARADLTSDITGKIRVEAQLPGDSFSAARVSFQIMAPSISAQNYSAKDVKATGSYEAGVLHLDGYGSAYDAFATVKGEWRTASSRREANTMAFVGQVRGLDVRRLPASLQVPKLSTMVAGQYAFRYDPAAWAVTLKLDRSTIEGAEIGAGTVAGVTMHGRTPDYELQGHVARLDLQRIGRPLHVATLAQDRFKSLITGDVHVKGHGADLSHAAIEADAKLTDSDVGPTHLPSATLAANISGRRLEMDISAPFEHLTDALLGTGTPMDLNGDAEGVHLVMRDLQGPISVGALDASGRVTLTKSTLAGYDVDQADVDASLTDGLATIRGLRVDGADLQARASGILAIDAEADSNLTFTLDAQNVETAAKLLGQPVAGAAHVEGSIKGPFNHLTSQGAFATRQFKYSTSFDAMTLNGTFTVDVQDQQWRDLTAHADTTATFVKLAGTDIEQLTASTTYHDNRLDIRTTIDQKDRSVSLTGSVLFEPEQEELRLRQLSVTTQNQTWALPAGREAVLQYGGDRLAISNFALARGPEQVGVEGVLALGSARAISTPGLDLKADNVELADLNQLASGTRKIGGVLNGTAHVSGTTSAPDVTSTFSVTNGVVQQATFQSLNAKVGYRDDKVTLDANLVQQPGAEIKAVGTVPLSLGSPAAGDAAMDVRVDSTPIDLGLFQALTTEVSAVKGTGQFNVHATGTPKAPHLNGQVDIAGAGFLLEATGMTYSGGNGRVRFDGDSVAIDHLVIQDDDHHTLTAEGGAEVANGRDLRSLDVHISGQNVHLLRNQYGELGLDLDLRASGALQHLDLTGQARVERGLLDVDKILEHFNKDAYSTTAEPDPAMAQAADTIAAAPAAAGANAPKTSAAKAADAVEKSSTGTPYDNATINVRLVMPDDMVVRANDLRVTSEGTGLGAMNLTLGGTLTVQKDRGGNAILLGRIQTERGFYDFQGRRFDIARDSDLQFHGEQPIDPTLNVSADRDISGVTTTVAVKGTMRQPQIELSSNPPLDQSDILSLIVFGQTVNTLGESQQINLAQRAGSLALGAVAGPISESVAHALNLDEFEVRAEGQGGGPEVNVGSQVGSHLFIGFRQEFGTSDVSAVQFEYRFSRLLKLVTSVAQGSQAAHTTRRSDPTGADLLYVIRY